MHKPAKPNPLHEKMRLLNSVGARWAFGDDWSWVRGMLLHYIPSLAAMVNDSITREWVVKTRSTYLTEAIMKLYAEKVQYGTCNDEWLADLAKSGLVLKSEQ